MTIQDAYQQFQIMPFLQLHQLRVAAVGQLLCECFSEVTEKQEVTTALLLHDMGNILKFKLDVFPEALKPEGKEYWQVVKDSFTDKYGGQVHLATEAIARELGVSDRVIQMIKAISFNRAKSNFESDDLAAKICTYADMRVAPHGLVSLNERLEDGRKRYQLKGSAAGFSYAMDSYLQKIEQQLVDKSSYRPETTTNELISELLPTLRNVEIP